MDTSNIMGSEDPTWQRGRAAALAGVPLSANPFQCDESAIVKLVFQRGYYNLPVTQFELFRKFYHDIGYEDGNDNDSNT